MKFPKRLFIKEQVLPLIAKNITFNINSQNF